MLPSSQPMDPRITNLLQRMFMQRKRFKAVLPGQLLKIRSSVMEDNLGGKTSDMIYLSGMMISRQEEPLTMGDI